MPDDRHQQLKRASLYDGEGRMKNGPAQRLRDVSPFDEDSESLKGSTVDRVEKASSYDRSGVIR